MCKKNVVKCKKTVVECQSAELQKTEVECQSAEYDSYSNSLNEDLRMDLNELECDEEYDKEN